MKKLVTTLCTVAALAVVANASYAANALRISQVFGGGGGGTVSAYAQDYVELFNSSGVAVNIGGWALEYGSATGNWGSSAGNYFVFPANTIIQPCSYLLVSCGTVGTGGPAITPTPDFNATLNLSASAGKVGLFTAVNANLPCGSEIAGTLVDKVAYNTANCPEVATAAGPNNLQAIYRNNDGMTDTDNNLADFTVTANPVPRNAASGPNTNCLATPAMNSTWGQLKSIYR